MKLIKIKKSTDKVLYTIVAVLLLCLVIITMISHIYHFSENEAYEKLHLETRQIKEDLNLQLLSDRENLITMANFAEKLYTDGQDFDLLFNSFEQIGLFENIGILLPDNSFLTKKGTITQNILDFKEECKKGAYISGRVKDLTYNRDVVRSAVPIIPNETTVAIIYGVINLDTLRSRYEGDTSAINAYLFVIEGSNGNFIINTKQEILGNISEISQTKFYDGFTYNQLISDLINEKSGYSSFKSIHSDKKLYAHYAPLNFGGWQIMLMQPENVVFAGASATGLYLITISALIILITVLYIVLIFISERKNLKISKNASDIKSCLLGINQQFNRIYEALEKITVYAKSRSSFIVDTQGEDFNYITPSLSHELLTGSERLFFVSKLITYISKKRRQQENQISMTKITANKELLKEMPDYYDFLKKHGIKTICCASVSNSNNAISFLGVINPSNNRTSELLQDIVICFTMAIYNKKHLVKAEEMALIDALTGVANRMAYKNDTKLISREDLDHLTCIYIDVNELNFYNNRYGHAAGDQMLAYIAEMLKKEFPNDHLYRMGGDEFLIFVKDLSPDLIKTKIENANMKIEEMKYHISVGIKYGHDSLKIEDMVNTAEKLMYEEKAKYYQNKEAKKISKLAHRRMKAGFTGIKEIDAFISTMGLRYLGVYCVSHKTDSAFEVLTPSYFSEMLDKTKHFSTALKKYIHEIVKPEYQRTLLNFLEYDILEEHLKNGVNPQVSYTKIDGEKVSLSIYLNMDINNNDIDTIWVFEKENL